MTTTSEPPRSSPPMVDDHIIAQLGIRRVSPGGADLAMEMDCSPQRVNSRGSLQGGLIATLVDVVAGMACLDGCPEGLVPTTTNLAVTFMAGIVNGPARATAHVLRRGRRSIVVQVEVYDIGADRLAAISTVSFAIVPIGSTQPDVATRGTTAR